MNKRKRRKVQKNRDPTQWWDRMRGFGVMFLKGFILGYLFYRSIILASLVGIVAGLYGGYTEKDKVRKRWQSRMGLEFREGLQGIAAALNAGYSIENAIGEACSDLELLYGKRSVLAPEFREIVSKIQLSCPVEQALEELADRSDVEDIRQFAEIFQFARRTGGDLIAITRTTADRISERLEVEREIEAMLAGKEMETKVMNLIPLAMILYLWLCSPGFLDCLYQGGGRIIMTVLFILYLTAYAWSERISCIKL